jgi:hypothetical protein
VHPERDQIDKALIAGQPYRNIAGRFSLSLSAVNRHRDSHLPASMAQAAQAAEVAHGDSLLDQVRSLQAKALGILKKAEDANDLRTALMAVREARGTLELLARLQGELQDNNVVNVLVASPEWLSLRGAILAALDPYPAARAAVAKAVQNGSS